MDAAAGGFKKALCFWLISAPFLSYDLIRHVAYVTLGQNRKEVYIDSGKPP